MKIITRTFITLLVTAVILLFGYVCVNIGVSIFADCHSGVDYSVPIYSIENNTFIEDQTSGKTHRDVEINRYNYTVKENGDYVVYNVSYDNTTITSTDGVEKIEFYKPVYDRPIFNKYFGRPSVQYKSRFYLHLSTIQKLGINTDQ